MEKIAIENMSFEEALAELEQIVQKIDTGQETLSNAVSNFERGILLKNHCDNLLKQAKLKVEQITAASDGSVRTEELNI